MAQKVTGVCAWSQGAKGYLCFTQKGWPPHFDSLGQKRFRTFGVCRQTANKYILTGAKHMWSVIIIDDNLAAAEMLSSTISWADLDCQVTGVAYDGLKGQALILANKPDIIISDIHMPELDGLKMIETTRQFSPESKVIFVSAYDDFRYAQKALSLRANEYLLKPFRPSALIDSVKRAITEIQNTSSPVRNHLEEPDLEEPDEQEDAHVSNTSLLVDSILSYIKSHLANSVSLDDLSRHFNLSPSYISVLIKKQTGQNFSDWLTNARIDLARQLLRQPFYRIGEIHPLVGYKNYISFYKVFVKATGMSPTEYRNQKPAVRSQK